MLDIHSWEYHVEGLRGHSPGSDGMSGLMKDLARLGEDRWEMVAAPTRDASYYVFKRPYMGPWK